MKTARIILAGGLLAIGGTGAWAGGPPASPSMVPKYINYQGRLMAPNGTPYSNTTHSIIFRLYDAPSGGTALWGSLRVIGR